MNLHSFSSYSKCISEEKLFYMSKQELKDVYLFVSLEKLNKIRRGHAVDE